MSEMERTRQREREKPTVNPYEAQMVLDRDFAERQMTGRVLVKEGDCPQELTRQGRLRFYLDPTIKDTPLQHWVVFTHEVRTQSGKHRHQGGLVIYVIDGFGYSIVDGEKVEWKKGDLVLLPMKENGVEHQHFNSSPDKPAVWMAFIHMPLREYVASEMTQSEVSPEYRAQEQKGGA